MTQIYHAKAGMLTRKGRPSVTPGSGTPTNLITFGMYNSCSTSDSTTDGQHRSGQTGANWQGIRNAYMDSTRIKVARTFDSTLPTTYATTKAKEYTDLGISPLWSFKAPPSEVIAGTHDATFDALATAAPTGTGFVYWHEPEDDVLAGTFTAAQWAQAFSRMHQRVKAIRGNQVWTAASHMTFHWGTGDSTTADPSVWSVEGNADLICADTYHQEFEAKLTSITDDSSHMRWHNWAKTQGVPIGMTEYGIVSKNWSSTTDFTTYYTDQQRATLLGNSIDWFRSEDYRMCLYWNSWHVPKTVAYRDINITPTASDGTSYPLTLAAWNSRVASYGSTKVWYGAP